MVPAPVADDARLHGEAARRCDGRLVGEARARPATRRRRCGTGPRPGRCPVTCSVTVCSTWMRGLHSMKKCSPRLGLDQELDRAGVHVAGGPGEAQRVVQDALAQRRIEARRRRDLDNLLVAQLDRAVALVEVDDVAVAVGQDLHLDVPRPLDQLLEEQRAVAERRLGLALRSARTPPPSRRRPRPRASRARRRRPPP